MRKLRLTPLALCVLAASVGRAEDWPEWRGKGRKGEWNETGILEVFPPEGLKVKWRTPLRSGFAGPAVAGGRVYLADFTYTQQPRGVERSLALDETTGKVLWTREWPVNYTGLATTYATGPRTTPTVDADRVYFFGAMGALVCLRTADGSVLWQRDLVRDFDAQVPVWGMAGTPLVDGSRVYCLAGGTNNAKVVAFDKRTGREVWRALASDSEPGYSSPMLVEAGGRKQLIQWHSRGVASLDPETGRLFWELPFEARLGLAVATPVASGLRLLVSAFFNGSMMMELDDSRPAARVAWRGKSDSEITSDGLHALIAAPVIDGDYIYGICSYGQLRCLDARTGRRVWETLAVTGEKARWAAAHIVRNGDRYFINNDRGELIIARLRPERYQEISRTKLIEPTSNSGNRRAAGAVNWSHPAYANRHIFARNDQEILCASLERK